jgi:hypothetical protein
VERLNSQKLDANTIPGDLTTGQIALLHQIQPIVAFIDAPSDLPNFALVVENLSEILAIALAGSRHLARSKLNPVVENIEVARNIMDSIEIQFPKAKADHGRSFHGYMNSYSHYCIYGYPPANTLISPQWRAMIASLLPLLCKLARVRKARSEMFSDPTIRFCRMLRKFSEGLDPSSEDYRILLELPVKATSCEVLLSEIQKVVALLGIELSHQGEYSGFWHIHRTLEWMVSKQDDWIKGDKYGRGGRQGPRGHLHSNIALDKGRQVKAQRSERESLKHVDDDGRVHKVFRFFDRPSEKVSKEENFDKDQVGDTATNDQTLEFQPEKFANYFLHHRSIQSNMNARYAAQAIELSNQRLPISSSTLSGYEIKCFLEALCNLKGPEWEGIQSAGSVSVAAWAACRFFLSRERMQVANILVRNLGDSKDSLVFEKAEKAMWLLAKPPKHQAPDQKEMTLPVRRTYKLVLPNLLVKLLDSVRPAGDKLFGVDHEGRFNKLLANINVLHGTELTPHRIERAIAEQMSWMAPADWVISTYFLGRPPNQHNPSVYSAVPVNRLQTLFNRVCGRLEKLAGIPVVDLDQMQFPLSELEDNGNVGSLHVPRIETVKTAISQLRNRLLKPESRLVTNIAALHNTYTAYVCMFYLATCGVRAVSGLIPAYFDFDRVTGLCFVSDKDNSKYTNSHLVWLHPELIKQFELYKEHLTRLRQTLAIENPFALDRLYSALEVPLLSSHLAPKRDEDVAKLKDAAPFLFFLSDHMQVLDVSPSHLVEYIGKDWELRVGALRHFLRTSLLHNGSSGEHINALLGHGERGEAPWGKFSTLPPAIWRQQIERALEPVVKNLGCVAMQSPLLD